MGRSSWLITFIPSADWPPRSSGYLRPEFPSQRLATWAQTHGGAELIDRRKVKPFFTLVRFRRAEGQSAAA